MILSWSWTASLLFGQVDGIYFCTCVVIEQGFNCVAALGIGEGGGDSCGRSWLLMVSVGNRDLGRIVVLGGWLVGSGIFLSEWESTNAGKAKKVGESRPLCSGVFTGVNGGVSS